MGEEALLTVDSGVSLNRFVQKSLIASPADWEFHLEELIKQKIINPQHFIKLNRFELNSIIKNN
jgi:hypothetical protein